MQTGVLLCKLVDNFYLQSYIYFHRKFIFTVVYLGHTSKQNQSPVIPVLLNALILEYLSFLSSDLQIETKPKI